MEQRFWNKVRRGADDECWEWLAYKREGYGRITWNRVNQVAHRIAWELTHGKIPDGLVVRHKCRGKCVNPNHLELGTQAENARDMIRDGTSGKKLTVDIVIEIKRKLGEGATQVALGQEFGVGQACISDINVRRYWAHV